MLFLLPLGIVTTLPWSCHAACLVSPRFLPPGAEKLAPAQRKVLQGMGKVGEDFWFLPSARHSHLCSSA